MTDSKEFNRFATKFLINDFTGLLKKYGYSFKNCPIAPQELRAIVDRVYIGDITRSMGKELISDILRTKVMTKSMI